MRIDTIAIEVSALAAGTGPSNLFWVLLGLAAVLLLAGAVIWFRRTKSAPPPDVSEEACAVIIAVLCEELRSPPEELRITSIRRL